MTADDLTSSRIVGGHRPPLISQVQGLSAVIDRRYSNEIILRRDHMVRAAVTQAQSHDFLKELRILDAAVSGGIREVFIDGDLRIGIRLQEIKLTVCRHP